MLRSVCPKAAVGGIHSFADRSAPSALGPRDGQGLLLHCSVARAPKHRKCPICDTTAAANLRRGRQLLSQACATSFRWRKGEAPSNKLQLFITQLPPDPLKIAWSSGFTKLGNIIIQKLQKLNEPLLEFWVVVFDCSRKTCTATASQHELKQRKHLLQAPSNHSQEPVRTCLTASPPLPQSARSQVLAKAGRHAQNESIGPCC